MANSTATKNQMRGRRAYVESLIREEEREEREHLFLMKAGIAFARDLGLTPVSSEYDSSHEEFGGRAIELILRGSYGDAFLRLLSYTTANDGVILAANTDGMDRFTLFVMGSRGLMLWGSGRTFGLSIIQK